MSLPKFENIIAPKPFKVPIPKKAGKKKGKFRKAVVYGDRHGISADPAAEQVLYAIIEDLEPDVIVNVGDDVDCYTISSFDRDPKRIHTLQDEIENTQAHFHKVAQIAPTADKYWLEGNHEDRLRRLVWRLPGASQELAKLKVVQEALTWEKLVGTKDVGFTFVPATKQTKTVIIPNLVIKHGTKLASYSAFTAKLEQWSYGKSGLSGHTHRLGKFYHRDLNGSHVWCETGCLCKLNDVDWAPDPDWQQGLAIVTYEADGSWFEINDIYIQDGKARIGPTVYEAK